MQTGDYYASDRQAGEGYSGFGPDFGVGVGARRKGGPGRIGEVVRGWVGDGLGAKVSVGGRNRKETRNTVRVAEPSAGFDLVAMWSNQAGGFAVSGRGSRGGGR